MFHTRIWTKIFCIFNFIISCIIGNNLKILIRPTVKNRTRDVNPKVTPKICGIVLVIPKLKPEYEATTLFGPGV